MKIVKFIYTPLLVIFTSVIAKPAVAQSVFATTITTFQVSPTGHSVTERSINDSVQTSQSSVSLTTDSQRGSSQTSRSEDGTTTQTNYNYGTTSTSVVVETVDVTRTVEAEIREEYDYNEFLIINNATTGYSF